MEQVISMCVDWFLAKFLCLKKNTLAVWSPLKHFNELPSWVTCSSWCWISPTSCFSLSLSWFWFSDLKGFLKSQNRVRQSRHPGLKNLRRPWLSRSVCVGLAPERGRASLNLYVLSAWLPHPGLAVLTAVHSCTSEGKQSQQLGIQTQALMGTNSVTASTVN